MKSGVTVTHGGRHGPEPFELGLDLTAELKGVQALVEGCFRGESTPVGRAAGSRLRLETDTLDNPLRPAVACLHLYSDDAPIRDWLKDDLDDRWGR